MNACDVCIVHKAKRQEEEVASSHAQSLSFSHGAHVHCDKIFLYQSFEPRHAR